MRTYASLVHFLIMTWALKLRELLQKAIQQNNSTQTGTDPTHLAFSLPKCNSLFCVGSKEQHSLGFFVCSHTKLDLLWINSNFHMISKWHFACSCFGLSETEPPAVILFPGMLQTKSRFSAKNRNILNEKFQAVLVLGPGVQPS